MRFVSVQATKSQTQHPTRRHSATQRKGRIYELWNALVRPSPDPCYVPCVIVIRSVLATRMKGAKGERRDADPSPRNGDRIG